MMSLKDKTENLYNFKAKVELQIFQTPKTVEGVKNLWEWADTYCQFLFNKLNEIKNFYNNVPPHFGLLRVLD